MLKLTFLSADRQLTKKYILLEGKLLKEPYPRVWEFTSRDQEVSSLREFADAITAAGAQGECLLKGNTSRALVAESRAGSTDANAPTKWLCLDVDRLVKGTTLPQLMGLMGMADVTHVIQYSSSYMIEPDRGLTCHVFVELDKPQAPSVLKAWLMHLNLSIGVLAEDLLLTATGNALSYPLDITTCQSDKLIYIAPPMLDGLEDPVVTRVEYVKGHRDVFALPSVPAEVTLRGSVDKTINRLREKTGLPARKNTFSTDKHTGLEVLNKPDAARLTGIKTERGFVYFNLNGGDSWGYFHPEGQPDVIRNFKGEPGYRTEDLLPEYWAQAQTAKKIEKAKGFIDNRVLVFRDFGTGIYYNGTWDGVNLRLAQAKSETQVQHFLLANGLPEIDWIPIWRVTFDPQSDVRVDFQTSTVNLFEPSPYMKQDPVDGDFPTIRRVIESAISRDPKTFDHFINWVAYIWQTRDRSMAAWVAHGIEGTGKGMLANHILAPLFGRKYVVIKRMAELEDQFNADLEEALFMIVDEAEINESRHSKLIMANLKNQITEPTISIRKMRTAAYSVRNHANWMFFSNKTEPVVISQSDRRFNVGEFRREKLIMTDAEIQEIAKELPAFATYLTNYAASSERARVVLDTEDRQQIISASSTTTELVAEALQRGMLETFWEDLPSGSLDMLPPYQAMLAEQYIDLVHRAVRGDADRFTRDELRVLFQYLCGDMPQTPAKFTQLLRHRGLHLKNMQINGRVCRGMHVIWNVDPEWLADRQNELKVPDFSKRKAVA